MFTKNHSRHKIKKILIEKNILENKCSNCGIESWLGKSISLHLDHINGINNDNRLENLRFLCPNCHSQTDTYCGKKNIENNHFSKKRKKVSDEELIKSLKNSKSIKEALSKVGLSGANNYSRAKKLIDEYNIENVLTFVKKQNINKEKIERLKLSNIDFTKFGWVQKASNILEISPQKTRKFIERHSPDLLCNAKIKTDR